MTRFKGLTVALAAGLSFLSVSAPSYADTLHWQIRSDYPYIVSLEFYSQNYDRAWPGNGNVYVLDDSAVHSYALACDYGEKICFGAWVRGDSSKYWGTGRDGLQGCSDCCYVCGHGGTTLRILNP